MGLPVRSNTSTKLRFGQLVLDESRVPAAATDGKVLAMLSERATADAENIFPTVKSRRSSVTPGVLVATYPELGLPMPNETHQQAAIVGLCVGKTSSRAAGDSLQAAVLSALCKDTPSSPARLAVCWKSICPIRSSSQAVGARASTTLPINRRLSSHVCGIFGMSDGPKLAQGRLPLVIHLLAPNQRAVQVTTDLRGFGHAITQPFAAN